MRGSIISKSLAPSQPVADFLKSEQNTVHQIACFTVHVYNLSLSLRRISNNIKKIYKKKKKLDEMEGQNL